MNKSAIVYWSGTGNTEALADKIFESAKANGKDVLFGSYGWGGGEWMNTWEDDCKSLGANLIFDSIICNDAPDDEALAKCEELGKAL